MESLPNEEVSYHVLAFWKEEIVEAVGGVVGGGLVGEINEDHEGAHGFCAGNAAQVFGEAVADAKIYI